MTNNTKQVKKGDWEIDGSIHVRRKGEKYFTEVNGNEWLSKAKLEVIEEIREKFVQEASKGIDTPDELKGLKLYGGTLKMLDNLKKEIKEDEG